MGDGDSYSLATAAALDCLAKAQQDSVSIDVVISCSITKFRGGLTCWLEVAAGAGITAGAALYRQPPL